MVPIILCASTLYTMIQTSRILNQKFIFKACRSFEQRIYRSIYTDEQLSIKKYVNDRNKMKRSVPPSSFESMKIQIRRSLKNYSVSSDRMVNYFTQYVHLIDDTADDFELLEDLFMKFKTMRMENSNNTSIGSHLMQMLHHFKKGQLALKLFNDPILQRKYLSGKQSLLTFYDLLYKQSEYAELLRQFKILKTELDAKNLTIMRSIYVLVFATCYTQNTEESFAYAQQLQLEYKDAHITQDHLIYLSALALNQYAPHIADQHLQTLWPTAHEAIPSLRLIALLHMQKYADVIQFLRSLLVAYDDNRTTKDQHISNEVIAEAEKCFVRFSKGNSILNDFHKLSSNLKTHGYIIEKSVKTMVFEPFKLAKVSQIRHRRIYLESEFNQINKGRSN